MVARPFLARFLILGIFLSGCGASSDSPIPWPIDSSAASDPERMVATPESVSPGQLVSLTFPRGHDRGLLFAIDAAVADRWERRAMLLSDANGGTPQWSDADADDLMVEMVGIAGPGPDRVPIPTDLSPGQYRICTVNAVQNLCVPIEVVAP